MRACTLIIFNEERRCGDRINIDIRVAGGPPWDMAEREQLVRARAAELTTAGATTIREEPTVSTSTTS